LLSLFANDEGTITRLKKVAGWESFKAKLVNDSLEDIQKILIPSTEIKELCRDYLTERNGKCFDQIRALNSNLLQLVVQHSQ
jgi:hypothetical protein